MNHFRGGGMLLKEPKNFTVFWINPLKGHLKKVHIQWKTIFLGTLLVILGIGFGIGGIFWYQNRIKSELGVTLANLHDARTELISLETKKKEQEQKLEDLAKKADQVIQEMNQLRELDQKVRTLLEKDLQSQLKKYGIDLGFSASSNELYMPVQMFIGSNLDSYPFGVGGPNFMAFSGGPVSAPSLRSVMDPEFYNKAKSINDNLSWLRAEMMVRKKSFNEIIQVAQKKDKLITMVPMRWPTWGRVTSSYGWRKDPFTGRKAWHTGVDIAAPAGRSVVATASGKVIYTGWNGNYGRCVIIRHQFGYETVFGHLSKINVNNGDEVKKENVIGKVGTTGRSTGPHLHYEVRKYGNVINPWPYLP